MWRRVDEKHLMGFQSENTETPLSNIYRVVRSGARWNKRRI